MYQSKRLPRQKQKEALDALEGKKAFALLFAMRVGKTKVIVDDFGRLAVGGKVDDLLIIAPGGVYRTWKAAIEADFPEELLARTRIFVWSSKDAKKAPYQNELKEFLEFEGPRIFVMNVEALSSVVQAQSLSEKFLSRRSMIAVDESVIIKNGASKRSKFILKSLASRSTYRRILTGLVSPRNPLDVYYQFKFLDPSIFPESFDAFRDRYAIVDRLCILPDSIIRGKFRSVFRTDVVLNFPDRALQAAKQIWPEEEPGKMLTRLPDAHKTLSRSEMVNAIFRAGRYIQSTPIVKEFRNLDELQKRLSPHCIRARLEDCYDLPPSDYSFRDVEFTPEQKRLYKEMKEFAITQLENTEQVTANQVITQILRLHQICCGHIRTDDGNLLPIAENRTKALVELLEDYEGKTIIWCSYDVDVRKVAQTLQEQYGENSVAKFWGGNVSERENDELRFKTNSECRFMISTPAAGGRGRPWEEADLVVYYSCREDLDHRLQSEERAKAVGKTRPVAYVDLRVPGTVEDRILQRLREKIDWSAAILGTSWRNWVL